MKKILKFLVFLMTLIGGISFVKAQDVESKVIVYWFDYDNYYQERPTSVDFLLKNMSDTDDAFTYNLKESEATIKRVSSTLTTWTFTITTNIEKDETFYGSFVTPDCYELDSTNSMGLVRDTGGLTEIYYYKNTMVHSKITINYHDDNGRDFYSRLIGFMILSDDDNYPEKETFNLGDDKRQFVDADTIVVEESFRGIKGIIKGSDDYMEPMNYKIHIMSDTIPGEVVYEWDGYNINMDIYRPALKVNIPLKVVWDDNDNSENLRPDKIKVEAYDQNGSFEQDFEIDNSSWEIEKELFKNMKYSNGKAIDYQFKVNGVSNYEFSVELVDGTYVITGKYVKEEVKETTIIENPNTWDNLYTYIVLGSVSLLGLVFSIKNLKKTY